MKAKKEGINLIESFLEFKELKSIDRPTLVRVLEDVFKTLIRRRYDTDEGFDVIVNIDKGDLEIWRARAVVADDAVENSITEVGVTEAKLVDDEYNVGDECYEPIGIEAFGRRAVQAARQTLVSRIMELEKDEVYRRYKDRVGELVVGEVSQVLRKELLVLDDATNKELILPRAEMIRGDFYRKGEVVRAVIKSVEMKSGNNPQVILSRTDERFLERLLELEVPEIEDGTIAIKKIVRQPGERAKIAVESYDDKVDPVGACVGVKGGRIHGIVRELRNENIDVINWTNNVALLIQRSLTPAKITNIELNTEKRHASVNLRPDEVAKAIGKSGLNIKLASQLTGFEIDVFREVEEGEDYDIDLDEFRDEIDGWIIDELKHIGCDTARSVLGLSREELVRRTDLEEETIDDVLRIINQEFDSEQ